MNLQHSSWHTQLFEKECWLCKIYCLTIYLHISVDGDCKHSLQNETVIFLLSTCMLLYNLGIKFSIRVFDKTNGTSRSAQFEFSVFKLALIWDMANYRKWDDSSLHITFCISPKRLLLAKMENITGYLTYLRENSNSSSSDLWRLYLFNSDVALIPCG